MLCYIARLADLCISKGHSVFIFKGYTVLDEILEYKVTMFLHTQRPVKPSAQHNISEDQNSQYQYCASLKMCTVSWLLSILTYPFDTFLEKAGYLSLSNCMNQFSCSMMWWYQLNTIDEPVQFLQHNKYIFHNKYYKHIMVFLIPFVICNAVKIVKYPLSYLA